jgi:hypothetical protein
MGIGSAKGSKNASFWSHFRLPFPQKARALGVLARRPRFHTFSGFPGRQDLRSAAACAVETQFGIFGITFKTSSFSWHFWKHFGDIWPRTPITNCCYKETLKGKRKHMVNMSFGFLLGSQESSQSH